ncbi:Rv3212 family protein [Gandjariella thermophila]|uniref:Pyrrolo-quinoline quinone repeat domain-containing protein n=1 Tax=Gandjariella thermophila TaxID=1931992 RepID=A0A4D4J4J4_9PSEU|nr:PQQ-binding-like beta-propeller repeat protein [Gandjariella thermophila]GDY30030.1 hypothetical protein GTS_16630 [Gandjariella thermophila]
MERPEGPEHDWVADTGRAERPDPPGEPADEAGEPANGSAPAHAGSGMEPQPAASRRRRSGRRWRRPADYAAVAVLLVVSLAAGLVVWWFSDERHTTSRPTPVVAAVPEAPAAMPPTLAEVWRAPSAGTQQPVAVGPNVVTGDGGEVDGRDPFSGQVRWVYRRNLPLCTVAPGWGYAVAVYHKSRNCSEVTALDGATGRRGPQRNGDAEMGTRLLYDGVHMTATGRKLIETWRSDLVRTQEYGTVPAIVNPGKQPRTGCVYGSEAVTTGRVAVVERCPDDPGDRVTVLSPDAKESDSDQPNVLISSVIGGRGARVVAVTADRVAVAVPNPNRLIVLDTSSGAELLTQPLDLPNGDLTGDPAGGVVPTATGPGSIYWFTGSRTIALSATDLRPQWVLPNTLGAGTVFAGRLLLPVPEGLLVLDPGNGAKIGAIRVDRQGYRGPIELGFLGPVVLEQRGGTLVALR